MILAIVGCIFIAVCLWLLVTITGSCEKEVSQKSLELESLIKKCQDLEAKNVSLVEKNAEIQARRTQHEDVRLTFYRDLTQHLYRKHPAIIGGLISESVQQNLRPTIMTRLFEEPSFDSFDDPYHEVSAKVILQEVDLLRVRLDPGSCSQPPLLYVSYKEETFCINMSPALVLLENEDLLSELISRHILHAVNSLSMDTKRR